ncbi:MAG: outer membrane lipoprotein carrier protein LolA [Pseudomonadota bacterium]
MKRLLFIFLALSLAVPAEAARLSLQEISGYINSIDTAKARFVQHNSDGSRSGGTLTIDRPGKARFEYDPPNQETLVLVGGGQVAVFDGRASGQPEQYPLRQTPLNLILGRGVDLTRARLVTGIGEHRGQTIIEAQDSKNPEYGKIRLYFEENPIRLSEWIVFSQSGEQTRVVLEPFQDPGDLSLFLFDITGETRRRQ